jgi:hypothetical protein
MNIEGVKSIRYIERTDSTALKMEERRATIMKPPPDDPSKAPIENILEITELGVLGPVRFALILCH